MAENVNTGGTRLFDYPKGYQPTADEQLKKEIHEAYLEADARKSRERKKKIIWWAIVILLILAVVIYSFLGVFK